MEHDKQGDSRWVDERLSSLAPSDSWTPDSAAAFARLRRREVPRRNAWWLWGTASATVAVACAILMLVSTPTACANPLGCAPGRPPSPAPPKPVSVAVAIPAGDVKPAVKASYKESGAPSAKVTCELYTDYECPFCATFYLDTLPKLAERYVETGKVRLIHRDFPLPRHKYSRLAARYANAAGEAGYYQAVANKLFRTQEVWSGDGNIEAQVARAVPAAAMAKVRAGVREDSTAEESVKADERLAHDNRIARTPTLLCNGHTIGPDLSIAQIEAQLDPLVGQR
jgi:protein-disulfide isomerase